MSEPRKATWWNPDGTWTKAPFPEQMQRLLGDPANDSREWTEVLRASGYVQIAEYGEQADLIEAGDVVQLYQYVSDRHLLVWVENILGSITEFFVRGDDVDAFMVDKLPQLILPISIQLVGVQLAMLRIAFAAWVRHGNSINTLDERGEVNPEERRRRQEYKRMRQQMEERAAAKNKGSKS